MSLRLSLPGRLLIGAVMYALATGVVLTLLATDRPWLGLRLAFDPVLNVAVVTRAEGPAAAIPVGTALTEIAADGRGMRLMAGDFILETDGVLATYADYEEFLRRQSALAELQASPTVTFTDLEGRAWAVVPEPSRPILSLPPEFWVQMAVGVIAWLISAGVWVFRQGEPSARYLLLSGWSTLLFAPTPAVYGTRELALPGELFRWLSDLNFLGGSLFAGTMVALMACYPRRIGPAWLGVAAVASQAGWWVAQQAGVFESMIFARRMLVMVALLTTAVLAVLQWRRTRRDPIGRAALRWFLLSWLVGSGVFGLLILLPQMFGIDTTPVQGYGFLLFVLVYVGLAFGILRFRLFGLDEWWGRIVTWLGALLLLVVLDLLFLLRMHLSSGASLSLALLICGVVWLPLRGFLAQRLLNRRERHRQSTFNGVVDVALAPGAGDQEERWRLFLQEIFDPLRIESVTRPETEPALEDDGVALLLPAVGGLGALRLEYARGGRDLFTSADLAAAREILGMLGHVVASRNAYEQGVHVERARIARDIHDNIGAQLLSALHSPEGGRRDEVLRETLADLRHVINNASNPGCSGQEALADLRHETAERLLAGGVALDWRFEGDNGIEELPARVVHSLRPVIRETISNILKHAQARQVRVTFHRNQEALEVALEDDGVGFDGAGATSGNGLGNMEARMAALNGRIERSSGSGGKGARVALRLPLDLDSHSTCATS